MGEVTGGGEGDQGPTVRVDFMAGGAQWHPVRPSGGKVRLLVGGRRENLLLAKMHSRVAILSLDLCRLKKPKLLCNTDSPSHK